MVTRAFVLHLPEVIAPALVREANGCAPVEQVLRSPRCPRPRRNQRLLDGHWHQGCPRTSDVDEVSNEEGAWYVCLLLGDSSPK
jgi:hypothetical protein